MDAPEVGGTSVFRMPSLGADMTDGVVTEWLVAAGDEVRRGQIVAVVETDKSDIEVEVFEHARVEELLVPEGERVEVGHPIAVLRPLGAHRADREPAPSTTAAAPASPPDVPHVAPAGEPPTQPVPASVPVTSPLVRHLAEELHVDLTALHGTGPGGRVQRADVEAAAHTTTAVPPTTGIPPTSGRPPTGDASSPTRMRVTPRARRLAAEHGVDLTAVADAAGTTGPVIGDVVLAVAAAARTTSNSPAAAGTAGETGEAPVDPLRSAIASLMARSWREIPHFHVTRRIDLGAALDRLVVENEGRPVTERVLPAALVLHAVARAAAAVPAVNGWWQDGRFRPSPRVDLGVVVSLRRGGIVAPTIAAADELSPEELMARLDEIVGRARRGRLRSSDTVPASLTVTNLGDRGADAVAGVIHPPQVALVGLGTVHDEPWAVDGEVVVRPVLHATLTGDHRAIDGLVGASFLHRLATLLEQTA
jgi:pyruvate dehydrogenase E2 component (dihydrolipoamide acetyltransferase)